MGILTIARYEMIRTLRNPRVVVILFAMPLLLIFILGSALSQVFSTKDRPIESVRVAVFNSDNGPLHNGLDAFFTAEGIAKYMQAAPSDSRAALEQSLRKGQADIGLVIPADFSKAAAQGREAQWEIILGRDRDKNFTGQMLLQSFIDTVNAQQATQIVLGSMGVPNPLAGMDKVAGSESQVEITGLSKANKEYSALQYYAANILCMFMLYSGMSAAISLVKQKENYTLARLHSIPIPSLHILLGNMTGNAAIGLLQAFIIIGGTMLFYGIHWGDHPFELLLVCLLTIFISMCIALLVTMLVKTTKAVTAIFQSMIMIMTFLSGGFNPNMGETIGFLGQFTVNHWTVQSMLQMMLGGEAAAIMHAITILAYMGAGFILISMIAYRKAAFYE